MNRYVVTGVIQDLIDGKTIRLVSSPLDNARAHYYVALVALQDACPELIERVCRVNGREHIITRTGGMLEYSSPIACRGYTGIVVAFDTHRMNNTERDSITMCGELVAA